MSKRFGRKQKRAMAAINAGLASRVDSLSLQYRQANGEAMRLRQRVEGNDISASILRDAKAMVAGLTAKAIVEAETEFLRDALSQLRRQGVGAVTLEVRAPDFSRPMTAADDGGR